MDDHKDIIDKLRNDMYGSNGHGKTGMLAEHNRMYRDMYANDETGEPGLFADVKAIRLQQSEEWQKSRDFRIEIRAYARAVVALVGLGVLTGVARIVAGWAG